jgi:hypothetical protein
MRRLVLVMIALVVGATTLATPNSTADAGAPVQWAYIYSNVRSPLLVGMSLKRAVTIADRYHIKLDVLLVYESSPKGTVTQEPGGLPGPILLVDSKGPQSNLRAVLPGAKGPPLHEECDPGFVVDVDGNGSPDTCGGNKVNVATWDYFAARHPAMYSLGRNATRCQVAGAYLSRHLDLTWDYSVYEMANAYYGWRFGQQFTDQLVNAGPYADGCKALVEPDAEWTTGKDR